MTREMTAVEHQQQTDAVRASLAIEPKVKKPS